MGEIITDKPLDLSCSKSNYNNYNSIISQKLSDNQPSQLPTEKTNITTTNTLPFSKTTITNVPTTTIQMSDATGTLSKLLQNFSTTKKSTTTITPATNNPPTIPRNPILKNNSNNNNNPSSSDFKKSSTTNNWIQEIVTDKPLDLSCSKSNYNNYNSIISQKLSDNQPSQLPTEKTNITTTNTLPFSTTYT